MIFALELFYPFDSEFMVRALIAAVVVGFAAPMIGIFVVQRGLSLVGEGLGHVAAAGVGLALWIDVVPQQIAIVVTVIAAIAIEWIFRFSKSTDTALALIFYSGIAASITFAGKSSEQGQLQQYLFGSILSVTWNDVLFLVLICLAACTTTIVFSKLFLSIAIDESSAKIAGVNTFELHIILMSSVALIVSISMSITGLLLIAAIMVVPVMSAQQLTNTFYRTWVLACGIGAIGSILGLAISRILDLAPGGTIVLTNVFIFVVASSLKYLNTRNRKEEIVHLHN